MRFVEQEQVQFGEIDISEIKFDPKSRDDTPKILMGLQYIYVTKDVRDKVFEVLIAAIPENVDKKNGRPGMELWRILVLAVIRLGLNCDYDRLHDLANNHQILRQMLGHGLLDNDYKYNMQTIKDNVALLTPDVLDRINRIVVESGHKLVKKKDEKLKGRCDSFVVETDVHYPTDINLLLDAVRKIIFLIARICCYYGLTDWRQCKYNFKKVKKIFRAAQQLKSSTARDEAKKEKRKKLIIEAHQTYLDVVQAFLDKADNTFEKLITLSCPEFKFAEIKHYISHANRQIDQIRRRVVVGEEIPHEEKVFSVFEEHTEWICKGKAGTPVELGLRTCVLEDQFGFILHHQVMEKLTDDKVAVSMVEETINKFPDLVVCSFDKGFYTPENRKSLSDLLDVSILPKKGKLSKADQEIETSEEFRKGRKQHSAVESAINALEHHGLDRCLDHGILGFKRYVSLAVLARNIQQLGVIIRRKEAGCRPGAKPRKKSA